MKDNEKKIYGHFVGIEDMSWEEAIIKINEEKEHISKIPNTENEIHFIFPTREKNNRVELLYKPVLNNIVKQHMFIELYTGNFYGKDRYLYLAMSYDVYSTDDSIYVEIVGTESVTNVEFFEYH